MVKYLSANAGESQETQLLSLSLKDPLEKEVEAHSSILAWRIPWTEKRGGLHKPRHGVA